MIVFLHKFLCCFLLFSLFGCGDNNLDPKQSFFNGDYELAYKLWLPLAEKGDFESQNYLGILYHLGFFVEKDYKKAVKWYKSAAEEGYPDAQKNYADMYYSGLGVSQDNYNAYKWYFAASQQGNKKAMKKLKAMIYYNKLTPNQQMHAKIDSNKYIKDRTKHFITHDNYIKK